MESYGRKSPDLNSPSGSLSVVVLYSLFFLVRCFYALGKLLRVRVLDNTYSDPVSCVVMTCCSCDCYYGGECNACGVRCCAGYADSVVLLLLSYAALSLVTASAMASTMVCVERP